MIQKIWGLIYIISVFTSIYAAETDGCTGKPNIPNATFSNRTENKITVSCKEEFSGTTATEDLLCENGTWAESKINCTNMPQEDVSDPLDTNLAKTDGYTGKPNIPNATFSNMTENKITVSSKEEFSGTTANEELLCENGTWAESKINCTNKPQEDVSDPLDTNLAKTDGCTGKPNIPNVTFSNRTENKITVSCKEELSGTTATEDLLCENGTWAESKINCINKQQEDVSDPLDTNLGTEPCTLTPTVENANIVLVENDTVEVTCEEGYKGIKDREELKCENGDWTESEINCTITTELCDIKPTIANAKIEEKEGILKVSCLNGYVGTKNMEEIKCQNGKWTETEINCRDICTILPNITNAEVELKKPGVAKVTCLEGYQGEIDEDEISCKDGIWKQEKISCTAQNVKKVIEKQMLKFTQFLLSAALHKSYLLCVFLTQNQTCDCLLGKLEFKKWEEKKIVSHNDERISNISLEECTTKCKNKQWCVSFEYSEKYRICHLSKTAHYMLNQLLFVKEKSVNYYEKVCLNEP